LAKLKATTQDDLGKIKGWIAADFWHKDDPSFQEPERLLTGQGLLSFQVADDEGSLCFVRLDAEGSMVRFATQFGPEEEVSKKRLVMGLLSMGLPAIINFSKEQGYKGLVFESTNAPLIAFMGKQGFKAAGGDDYSLVFEEINV
jgi:hypothetical protein